jgi:hypothetical protein
LPKEPVTGFNRPPATGKQNPDNSFNLAGFLMVGVSRIQLATPVMAEIGQDRRSFLENCRLSAPSFLLSDAYELTIINEHAGAIIANWGEVCDEGRACLSRSRLPVAASDPQRLCV